MEEIFEGLAGLIIVAVALSRAFAKKKKKQDEKPARTMPEEAFETRKDAEKPAAAVNAENARATAAKVAKVAKQVILEEILEIEDEEARPSLEHVDPVPVPPVTPAASSVHPAAAAVNPAAVMKPAAKKAPVIAAVLKETEGDCLHPEHTPMPRHKAPERPATRVRPAEEEMAAPHIKRRFDSADMRRAVVTSEILSRPVSLRRRPGRV